MTEAVKIRSYKGGNLLNNKQEYRSSQIPEIEAPKIRNKPKRTKLDKTDNAEDDRLLRELDIPFEWEDVELMVGEPESIPENEKDTEIEIAEIRAEVRVEKEKITETDSRQDVDKTDRIWKNTEIELRSLNDEIWELQREIDDRETAEE